MKYRIKYILALSLTIMFGLSSCADSWLETVPTSTTGNDEIFATTQNAKQVINGMCRIMVQQHSYYGQSFNGEGTMKLLYGEYPGQDFFFPYMAPGWSTIMNHASTQTLSNTSLYDSYPWYYYYLIIGNANAVISRIGKATGTQEERDFIKAEALTFRAYSFFRLTQIYCEPWYRSNNGATDGIVLRLDEISNAGQDTDMPLSTLAQTYQQVYDDLDEALELYTSSGLSREDMYPEATSQVCFPDETVAHAVYAQASLTRQDYSKALTEAQLASTGHDLMDVSDYKTGFCIPNNEWIWGVYNDAAETIWYYGWQLFMACNGYYSTQGLNVCISRTLAESFDDTDIRKGLFLTESTFLPSDGSAVYLDLISQTSQSAGKFTSTDAGKAARTKANSYVSSTIPAAYTQNYTYASLKFQATGQPAVGSQPIMRTSEMLLIEAEANYFLNSEQAAIDNLIALNKTSDRDANYSCSKSGDELLKEIKKYRRLELWGEGYSWFDCKRWGDPVERPGFAADGNYSSYISGTRGYDADGNYDEPYWKWIIPGRETDYNSGITYE